jgi:rubrerythrin
MKRVLYPELEGRNMLRNIPLRCRNCSMRWKGTYPARTKPKECPYCGAFAGVPEVSHLTVIPGGRNVEVG